MLPWTANSNWRKSKVLLNCQRIPQWTELKNLSKKEIFQLLLKIQLKMTPLILLFWVRKGLIRSHHPQDSNIRETTELQFSQLQEFNQVKLCTPKTITVKLTWNITCHQLDCLNCKNCINQHLKLDNLPLKEKEVTKDHQWTQKVPTSILRKTNNTINK